MTFTKESFLNRIQDDLYSFPRNSDNEDSKRIFSIYTTGRLPDICFKNKEDNPECSGTILLECLKNEKYKNFILVFIFEDPISGYTLDDYFTFDQYEADKMWESCCALLKSLNERGPIHILSVGENLQNEEKYGVLFDAWRGEIENGK